MTGILLDHPAEAQGKLPPIYAENVIPQLAAWVDAGLKTALVTLVGVDGTSPRAEGAQMAVCETGQWAGYISGGCLEQAIALEAAQAIEEGGHRLIRYGKGSPYFDIRLPCGSGLDILIQPNPDRGLVRRINQLLDRRHPFSVRLDLRDGRSELDIPLPGDTALQLSSKDGEAFIRAYPPVLRCLIAGGSPIGICLAQLCAEASFEVVFHVPDEELLPALPASITVRPLTPPYSQEADDWTAAILAFHDHEQEMPLFRELLGSKAFFVTAIGSRKAHEARVAMLSEAGFDEAAIARIASPAGLIPGLKSAHLAAVSILAEVIAAARDKHLIA